MSYVRVGGSRSSRPQLSRYCTPTHNQIRPMHGTLGEDAEKSRSGRRECAVNRAVNELEWGAGSGKLQRLPPLPRPKGGEEIPGVCREIRVPRRGLEPPRPYGH